jgi:selenocysteine-specific elongation factor
MKSIVIGTAGHIDHGKTALVKAITGIDPSRLSEEKARGITIDLGFAHREVTAPDGSSLQLSFVDVPGHAGFIRNMLAGVGGIDMVLLVISAEEGVKPQTREHLAICSLLGVRRGLAVLTKSDGVTPERLAAVRDEVSMFLKGSFLENGTPWPLPVSAHTGEGLPELIDHMTALASALHPRDADGPVRLPIDRSFSMHGFGTVVTGTLIGGSIALDQKLSIEPGARSARIRSIQMHGRNCDRVVAGSRVALNLAGIDHSQIERGDMIVAPQSLSAVNEIDAEITLLPGADPLKHGSRLTFHAHTSDSPASVLLYGRSELEPGSNALARLKLGQRVVLAPGDCFILRLPSPSEPIAGGVVLDATPLQKQSRSEARHWLESLQEAKDIPEALLLRRVARRQREGLDRAAASNETGMTQAKIGEIFGRCVGKKKIVEIGGSHFVVRDLYEAALARLQTEIDKFHAEAPAQSGIKRADLQSRSGLPPALATAALDELARNSVVSISGDTVSRQGFDAKLNASDHGSLDAIAGMYVKAGLETPTLRDIAASLRIAEREVQRLLVVLLRDKILAKIGNDAYVHRDRLTELRSKLSSIRGQSMDVVQFKQLTGLSRKYAIPWLEYLDRERVTSRVGDVRLVL